MNANRARRFTPIAVTAAIALCAALTGCGATYTKADFIARADAICTSTVQQARAIPPPSFAGSSAQTGTALSAYLARLLPVIEAEVRQLRALPRPAGEAGARATLRRWLDALERDLGSYRALADAARRGDSSGVTDAEAALQASPATSLAAGYGLDACATAGGTVGSGV